MRAEDRFHVGIVVDEFEPTLEELSDLFGYSWCPEIALPNPVSLPTGDTVVDLRFTYSRTVPRVEVIQTIPGSLWVPAADSGIHHLGYWSDDVTADSAHLVRRGYLFEAAGVRPDGSPFWSYHRRPGGPRIEIVSRELDPSLQKYWESERA